MNSSHRLDVLESDVAPDEALPEYDAVAAPRYQDEGYLAPLHSFHLRQVDRKVQLLVPFGPSSTAPYKIMSQGTFRLFSKKPEMQVLRTSLEHGGEDCIASIYLDDDGPLPWRPRAHFSLTGSTGVVEHAMESRNFADWATKIGGTTFAWRLESKPMSIALSEKSASIVIARFTYSSCGTTAANGAEVGELTIYRDGLSVHRDGIDKIVCSLLVAIVHFKKMGRHYRNDAPVRTDSLTRELMPQQRMSVSSGSTLWTL